MVLSLPRRATISPNVRYRYIEGHALLLNGGALASAGFVAVET